MIVSIEPIGIEEVSKALALIPKALERATKIAARKTLQGAKRDAINLAKRRYTLPAGVISSSLRLSVSGFGGTLTSTGAKNPLEKAKTAPKGRITARGRFIRATVVKGQDGTLRTAFRKTSSESIFERIGRTRFPIRKLKTVSAPQMVGHSSVAEPVADKMAQRFSREFFNAASFV